MDIESKLPYKIGEKVYVLDYDFDGCTLKIFETTYSLGLYEYGAKVYLSKDEAWEALEMAELRGRI